MTGTSRTFHQHHQNVSLAPDKRFISTRANVSVAPRVGSIGGRFSEARRMTSTRCSTKFRFHQHQASYSRPSRMSSSTIAVRILRASNFASSERTPGSGAGENLTVPSIRWPPMIPARWTICWFDFWFMRVQNDCVCIVASLFHFEKSGSRFVVPSLTFGEALAPA